MTLTVQVKVHMGNTYQFRIDGHLDDRWSHWFEELAISVHDDGTTTLVGQLIDQAAVYGVLLRIRDLGLSLISVNRTAEKK